MNIILLKESLKRDLLIDISKYEKKYRMPVFLTSAVISEILCEIKSAEMQEMLKGDLNERRDSRAEERSIKDAENADKAYKAGEG